MVLKKKLRCSAENEKNVCKSLGNPYPSVVIDRGNFRNLMAESFAAFPKVRRNIKDLIVNHADQFSLRLLDLVIQTAQHDFDAGALIVLRELHRFVDGLLNCI